MTSTSGSQQRSRPVSTAAILTHDRVDVQDAVERVRAVAERAGVGLVEDPLEAELAIVLGGDGTMLRALARLLGTDVPVIGVNFGRVGFLASVKPEELEESLQRVLAGEYVVVELPTLEARVDGETHVAVNDVFVSSSILGRMIELSWAVGGEDLGTVPCDGMICATSTGSTAYNLSNGGPVLVRGLDAMAVTFIAPHSLHGRPLVVPRGLDLTVRNVTADVPAAVLVDGHRVGDADPGEEVVVDLGDERCLLATLPETTFFTKYRETFSS
jgi:NAD+ kinase